MNKTILKNKFTLYTKSGNGADIGSSVMALGTFDGVHIAHQRLLDETAALKDRLGAACAGAWCFSSPPASVLGGVNVPQLTTVDEKVSLLLDHGMDFVAVGDFRDFKDVSAEDFVRDTLIRELSCVGAVCGYDHRFGKGGSGSAEDIEAILSPEHVIKVPKIEADGVTVSSSEIRQRLSAGDVGGAALMLGRPYSVTSVVLVGKRLGRDIGFPTANVCFPASSAVVKHGIYAVKCTLESGEEYVGTANVGVRPSIDDSIDDHTVNCETYIHNFSGDLYGKALTVSFHAFLRPEMRFDSLDALKAAIARDVNNTAKFFEQK